MTAGPTTILECKLLTREQICFVFDVGESTVDEWTRKKLLPYFKVGRVVRFEPGAVLEFLKRYTMRQRGQTGDVRWKMDPTETDFFWQRIQRLIADQVRAELLKQMGSEPGHIAA